MKIRSKAGNRSNHFGVLTMAVALTIFCSGIASAGNFIWDPVTGATGYKVYYSTDNTITTDDPNVDVGNVIQYELCSLPLEPCTTYYIQAAAYNAGGEIFTGIVYEYANNTPQITVPPQAINVQHDSATIQWTTDVLATSVVNYGTTALYGLEEALPTYEANHSVVLTALISDTTYHFMATSFDPDNCGPGCNASDNSPPSDQVFTTQPAPDLEPPVITSGADSNIHIRDNRHHRMDNR